MQEAILFSAPNEPYTEHVQKCKEKFSYIFYHYYQTIVRTFGKELCKNNDVESKFIEMIVFHDIGKLTKRWQDILGSNYKMPSHASIGAAYIWDSLPVGLKEPLSFAVAIHHTDKGLLGDNIEKPDVQAILDNIIDYSTGNIIWHENIKNLTNDFFPKECYTFNIDKLKSMRQGLRIWSKGCSILEQHKRRIQVSLAHQILKLCDISAASERKEYKNDDDSEIFGGWLMVKHINEYVNTIISRERFNKLNNELKRWTEILKKEYKPLKIIAFGSYAQGKVKQWSDIDIIIIKNTEKCFLERSKEVLLLLQPEVGIDVLVYTPDEYKELCETRSFFKNEIYNKGVTIYEK